MHTTPITLLERIQRGLLDAIREIKPDAAIAAAGH